ncbi:MAG: type II toxin-antitoxin system PemK/MazF family toxin [Acidobacteriota bacterium]
MTEYQRVSRGEIREVDWSPGRGSEQTGRRPALIVQNDHGNHTESYPNTIVVAVSSKGRNIPFHVRIVPSAQNGLKTESHVKCEQILTVSKARIVGRAWGRLTNEEMAEVEEAIRLSLGMTKSR